MHPHYTSMVGRFLTLTDCVMFGYFFMMTCGLLVMQDGSMMASYGLHQSPPCFSG
jgi:hypothetical protein